jgi:hypothetical protein
LVCVPYQVERGHQTMGIQRMYHYQLPLTRQLGLLGFTADSAIRYLSVSMDVNPGPGGWRYFATIHFKRNGEVEIGRTAAQSLQPDSLGRCFAAARGWHLGAGTRRDRQFLADSLQPALATTQLRPC